jgi:hypothetical protein
VWLLAILGITALPIAVLLAARGRMRAPLSTSSARLDA